MKKPRRLVIIPTPESLANAALFYLSRYAASEGSLRRVLENRLRRASLLNADFAKDRAQQNILRSAIDDILARYKKSGAVNDAAFADIKVSSLRRAGRSRRVIQQMLSMKGLGRNTIEEALVRHDDEADPRATDIQAARAFAKRKRLGKFREGTASPDRLRKDFAALARNGFSYDIARQVLERDLEEEEF